MNRLLCFMGCYLLAWIVAMQSTIHIQPLDQPSWKRRPGYYQAAYSIFSTSICERSLSEAYRKLSVDRASSDHPKWSTADLSKASERLIVTADRSTQLAALFLHNNTGCAEGFPVPRPTPSWDSRVSLLQWMSIMKLVERSLDESLRSFAPQDHRRALLQKH